jgi:hypothetical protein
MDQEVLLAQRPIGAVDDDVLGLVSMAFLGLVITLDDSARARPSWLTGTALGRSAAPGDGCWDPVGLAGLAAGGVGEVSRAGAVRRACVGRSGWAAGGGAALGCELRACIG